MDLRKIKISKLGIYIQNILKAERPFKMGFGQLLILLGMSDKFKIQRDGYLLKFHPSALSLHLFVSGRARSKDEKLLTQILNPGENVVDVGANIGNITLKSASLVKETGRVFSIEPHPSTFSYLKSNVDFNDFQNIELFNCGLGDVAKSSTISDRNSDDQNRIQDDEASGVQVEIRRLDDLIPSDIDISLLKIDTEGYEKFVLDGAPSTLSRTNTVIIEISDEHFKDFGYSSKEVFDILESAGFDLHRIEDGKLITFDSNGQAMVCEDIVCTRKKSS